MIRSSVHLTIKLIIPILIKFTVFFFANQLSYVSVKEIVKPSKLVLKTTIKSSSRFLLVHYAPKCSLRTIALGQRQINKRNSFSHIFFMTKIGYTQIKISHLFLFDVVFLFKFNYLYQLISKSSNARKVGVTSRLVMR